MHRNRNASEHLRSQCREVVRDKHALSVIEPLRQAIFPLDPRANDTLNAIAKAQDTFEGFDTTESEHWPIMLETYR
jgi:hypothetical protein